MERMVEADMDQGIARRNGHDGVGRGEANGLDKVVKGQVDEGAIGPDPEVAEHATRRRFGAEYKLSLLREADGCSQPGEIGALLRREGLYSSCLTQWRRQREGGSLGALSPKKRGRRPAAADPLAGRIVQLERENQLLQRRLAEAELIIQFQKKVAALLGVSLRSEESR